MRPINLVPEEERPDGRRPLRAGPLAYVLVGVLAAAVIGVTMVVVTETQISERKNEVTRLQAEEQAAKAEAEGLSPYTQFHSVREQRVETMASLADSRFDWPRVMRELSLVLPSDVHLSSLGASASLAAGAGASAGVAMRSGIAGPALELVGCASSQSSVGGLLEALKDIDGVTRVGVQSSAIGGESESGTVAASTCGAGRKTAQFQLVVAFDAAPVPAESGNEAEVAPAPEEEATAEPTSSEGESAEQGEG